MCHALTRHAHGECPFGSVQFKQTDIGGAPELRVWDDDSNKEMLGPASDGRL